MSEMYILYFITHCWQEDAPYRVHWLPVCLGVGILLYFAQSHEPSWLSVFLVLAGSFLLHLLMRIPWTMIFCLIALGYAAAKIRTNYLGTLMIDTPIKELRIEAQVLDYSIKNHKERVILGLNTSDLPGKVRLTLNNDLKPPPIGSTITATATLLPLTAPQTPRDYNFRRTCFFEGIGATGVLKEISEIKTPPSQPMALIMTRMRNDIKAALNHALRPETAGIAIALVTGDRGYVSATLRQQLTDAGLAHLLAISGLHLSLIAGLLFFSLRLILCLSLNLAENVAIKKVAILITWPLLLIYLLISGMGVPAQRAFIMISLVFAGILFHRPAFSMRTICLAATLILLMVPESLLSASFQLSFAAVTGLIAVFEKGWLPLREWAQQGNLWRKGIQYLVSIIITTLIATLATTPFSLYIFNRFSLTVIISNLLAVPLTAIAIMPLLLLAVISLLIGKFQIIFSLLDQSINLLIQLAERITAIPGGTILIAKPSPTFLGLAIIGGLWMCLWRQPWRYLGFFPIGLSLPYLAFSPPCFIFIPNFSKTIFLYDKKTLTVHGEKPNRYLCELLQRELGLQSLEMVDSHYLKKSLDELTILSTRSLRGWAKSNKADLTVTLPPFKEKESFYIEVQGKEWKVITGCDLQGNRPWSERRCDINLPCSAHQPLKYLYIE